MHSKETKFKTFLSRLRWHYENRGLKSIFISIFNIFRDRFIIKSRYLFVVELSDYIIDLKDNLLLVDFYNRKSQIPKEFIEQLNYYLGPGRADSFLDHFFNYGCTLWLGRFDNNLVGLRWTLDRGFDGFYCMPLSHNDVITLAGQIFYPHRGKGYFSLLNSHILNILKHSGKEKVYTGVHTRNRSMIKAMEKANIPKVGKLVSFKLNKYWFSIWDSKTLQFGHNR